MLLPRCNPMLVAIVAVAALVAPVLPLSSAKGAEAVNVTYATLAPSAADWPVYLAQSQGFFADEGLHVEIVYLPAGPQAALQALATNATTFCLGGTDTLIAAVAHHLPVRLVGSMFAVNPYSLLTTPEIKGWDDLRGKSIALGTKADVTAIVLQQLAAAHGLKNDDFSIVIGGNSGARFAALTSGNVQGAILSQPFDILAQAKGMHVLASAVDSMREWTFNGLAVNPAWAADHRPIVAKMLRALQRAMRYGYTHKDQAVATLIAVTHVDAAIAAQAYDEDFTRWRAFDPEMRFSPASLQYITRLQIAMGILTAAPAYRDVYDPSFAAEAFR